MRIPILNIDLYCIYVYSIHMYINKFTLIIIDTKLFFDLLQLMTIRTPVLMILKVVLIMTIQV